MDLKTLAFLLLVPAISYGLNGGIKVRITKQGLDYVGEKLIQELSTKLINTPIPNISGRKKRVTYSATGIKLSNFAKPTLTYQGKAGSSFQMSLKGAGIRGRGNWRYKYKLAFIKISDSGSVKIDVRGINIQIHATMGVKNSKATIKATTVHCSISRIRIKLRSKISWLYNLVIKLFRKKIKRIVEKKVKSALKQAINVNVKKSLKTLKLRAKVMDKLHLNYALTSAPYFAQNYIEASMAGTFLSTDTNAKTPIMALNSGRMLMVAISEVAFNNFANAAFKKNLLKFVYADKNSIKALLPPSEQKDDANLSFKVTVTAREAPKFNIVKKQISCSLTARVLLDMFSSTGRTTFLDADIKVTPTFTISVVGELVKFQVISVPFEIIVVDNEVTVFDKAKLQSSINTILQWLMPQINEEAKKGFKLPSLKKVALTNGAIGIHEGYVDVATDFSFI